jgi:hypothetical protein
MSQRIEENESTNEKERMGEKDGEGRRKNKIAPNPMFGAGG